MRQSRRHPMAGGFAVWRFRSGSIAPTMPHVYPSARHRLGRRGKAAGFDPLAGGFAVWAAEIRRKAAQARHFVLCITSCGIQ
jgi:hypothetical protein